MNDTSACNSLKLGSNRTAPTNIFLGSTKNGITKNISAPRGHQCNPTPVLKCIGCPEDYASDCVIIQYASTVDDFPTNFISCPQCEIGLIK